MISQTNYSRKERKFYVEIFDPSVNSVNFRFFSEIFMILKVKNCDNADFWLLQFVL